MLVNRLALAEACDSSVGNDASLLVRALNAVVGDKSRRAAALLPLEGQDT